jgi:hypothetical protein
MDDKLYGTSPVKEIFCAGDEAILRDVEKSKADGFLRKSSPRLLDWVFLFLFRDQHQRQKKLILPENTMLRSWDMCDVIPGMYIRVKIV